MKNIKNLLFLVLVLVLIPIYAFAAASLFTAGRFHGFNPDGTPLQGGQLFAYQAGTTTPQNTFTNQGGLTANTNPVILDANGEADVWLNGDYKFVLQDSNGNPIWT